MDLEFFLNTELFHGMDKNQLEKLFECIEAHTRKYKKGEIIFHMGEAVRSIGMVICGSVIIKNDDLWGNKSILSRIDGGNIFGETYACTDGEPMMVNAVADENTEIVFFDIDKILELQGCHSKIIKNLLRITANKNLQLSRRILHTSAKSIRGRLMSYFSECSKQAGSRTIKIAFNRQQLADYLSVDRSAMCSELSKMKKDGLIEYNKNKFRLLQTGYDLIFY